MKIREITTQLTDEQAQKFALIQDKTKQNAEEVLASALDYYYQHLLTASDTHLDKFSRVGFVGCIEAEPNLAKDSESILMNSMAGKSQTEDVKSTEIFSPAEMNP